MKIKEAYQNLENSYLFSTISKRVTEYKMQFPDADIIRLGIGDVTLPLAPTVVAAMQKAVLEMGTAETFKGYGEEQGYGFLRQKIALYYSNKGVQLEEAEIFISDGAKSDIANILDVFSLDNQVFIPNPVYPVYEDSNRMLGRELHYLEGNEENGFLPMPEQIEGEADIVYLCSPNNPTGAVYNKEQLQKWVEWANERDAILLFDAAYEAFIQDEKLPSSIYQIKGAKQCAIEFCSLSKTAGFTGTRCGYTVVPKALMRSNQSLNALWLRRQSTKFNGVAYLVQKGAEAVFEEKGLAEIKKNINYYMENAAIMAKTLEKLGIWFIGGENSPYIWMKCPNGLSSWEFFDLLLTKYHMVGTPGAGFGEKGEGYFRLTAFGKREDVIRAMERMEKLYFK